MQLLARVYGLFHIRQGNALWEKSVTMSLKGLNDTVRSASIQLCLVSTWFWSTCVYMCECMHMVRLEHGHDFDY